MNRYDEKQDDPDRPGIKPCLWGGHLWESLHYITLGYAPDRAPPRLQRAAREFLGALPYLLPCILCRRHLAEIYETVLPIDDRVLQNQETLGAYIVELRDYVKRHHVLSGHAAQQWPRHTFEKDVRRRLPTTGRCPRQTTVSTYLVIGGLFLLLWWQANRTTAVSR